MHLSRRQSQIMSLVAGGLADKQIALRLGLSVTTVRTHLQRFYRANHLHSRARAAIVWMETQQPSRIRFWL